MEKPKTVGVFAGLLDEEGKLLLQRRTEKKSIIPGKSYRGDWELPGGKVEEKDVMKALTLDVLGQNLIREVKEELGIEIVRLPNWPALYLAVFVNQEKEINDWAFTIPIIHAYWTMPNHPKREVVMVSVDELTELTNNPPGEGQILSGFGKRMHRMSLGALYKGYMFNPDHYKAKEILKQIKPDWYENEYSDNTEEFLAKLRREIS